MEVPTPEIPLHPLTSPYIQPLADGGAAGLRRGGGTRGARRGGERRRRRDHRPRLPGGGRRARPIYIRVRVNPNPNQAEVGARALS